MLTRKYYQEIARVIGEAKIPRRCKDIIIFDLIDFFSSDNPKFSPFKFREYAWKVYNDKIHPRRGV